MHFGYRRPRLRLLYTDQLNRFSGDVFGGDFKFLDQLPGSAGVSEAVFYSDGSGDDGDAVELGRLGDGARYWPREGADLVLFGGQDYAGVASSSNDGPGVERLHGVHIEDAGFVAEILL